MSVTDHTVFQRAEEEELADPSIPLEVSINSHTHPVYASRGQPLNFFETSGASMLSDFGSARFLDAEAVTEGWWMPDTYRAPEVLMSVPWGHGVDIWCIGMLVSFDSIV